MVGVCVCVRGVHARWGVGCYTWLQTRPPGSLKQAAAKSDNKIAFRLDAFTRRCELLPPHKSSATTSWDTIATSKAPKSSALNTKYPVHALPMRSCQAAGGGSLAPAKGVQCGGQWIGGVEPRGGRVYH